jgi:hypothetical protein
MEMVFLIGLLIAVFAIYRLVSRRLAGQHAAVRTLLWRCHLVEKTGLSERECLFF